MRSASPIFWQFFVKGADFDWLKVIRWPRLKSSHCKLPLSYISSEFNPVKLRVRTPLSACVNRENVYKWKSSAYK